MVAAPVALAGACVLPLALQAPTWRVERSRTMRASPERLRDVLSDVRAFAACCAPAEARVSPRTTTFSRTTQGPGAWLEWSAAGVRERGTIEAVRANGVSMRYDVGGRRSRQIVEWRRVGARRDRTEVTWALEGDKSGVAQRLVWPLAGLDSRLGASIEEALASLDRATR